MKSSVASSVALLFFASFAGAQGADDCASAQFILGDGTVAFDNSAATLDGQAEALCADFGTPQMDRDVWFAWTASATGTVTLETCGETSVDTKLAAYAGPMCPASGPLDCDDDTCGLQSSISFVATAGDVYLVRVGVFLGAGGGAGTLRIATDAVAGGDQDDCASAAPISGMGAFAFDVTAATTDGPPGIERDVWFIWTAPATDTFTISTCGGTTVDTSLAAYAGATCPSGSPLASDDDSCGGLQSEIYFAATAGATYLLRIGTFPGAASGSGTFDVTPGVPGRSCAGLTGPDLIAVDLHGITNFGGAGGVGGYAIGATFCNVGDETLAWLPAGTAHPVIAQNVYRYEDGRFEQLGMSWLRHGASVLQLESCCDCTPSGTSSALGVGCSHATDAGLNGLQGALGRRSEVDAFRGVFSYPFTDQGATGNALYKRIRIPNTELDPILHPGALYYGEVHAIAADDSAASNQDNNASWRELLVEEPTNAAFSLVLRGPTRREQPAIRAWQAVDPFVQLDEVHVPGEGLFVVGSRATDNQDGTWHYEYAVYNMNSDRSAGSFSIPVGGIARVTNIGFTGIEHHSGEPYDGSAWAGQRTGDAVTWMTTAFAADPNANALRFGTLYNFRFDADRPPIAAIAALGLFKPGTPSSVGASVQAPDVTGGANYCLTAPNSAGAGAMMGFSGSLAIPVNAFTLEVSGGIPGGIGLFYFGAGETRMPFGEGFRCVTAGGSGIFRLPPAQADPTGNALRGIDFNAPPTSSITPGSTWKFQYWYRDPTGGPSGFNLSDGLSATFEP